MSKKSAYYDEAYVEDILHWARPGMTHDQFNEYVQKDLNAGYVREVGIARLEYFKAPLDSHPRS